MTQPTPDAESGTPTPEPLCERCGAEAWSPAHYGNGDGPDYTQHAFVVAAPLVSGDTSEPAATLRDTLTHCKHGTPNSKDCPSCDLGMPAFPAPSSPATPERETPDAVLAAKLGQGRADRPCPRLRGDTVSDTLPSGNFTMDVDGQPVHVNRRGCEGEWTEASTEAMGAIARAAREILHNFPRRNVAPLWIPAERAIQDAVDAVERVGAGDADERIASLTTENERLRGVVWALADAFATRCLADANRDREAPNDWPAGQKWDDLVATPSAPAEPAPGPGVAEVIAFNAESARRFAELSRAMPFAPTQETTPEPNWRIHLIGCAECSAGDFCDEAATHLLAPSFTSCRGVPELVLAVATLKDFASSLRSSLAASETAREGVELQLNELRIKLATYKLDPNDVRRANDSLRDRNSALNVRATQAEALVAALRSELERLRDDRVNTPGHFTPNDARPTSGAKT